MYTIKFYRVDQPYGCFSNFARFPVLIEGVAWPTSEHYFQAGKFIDERDRDQVRAARTPFLAAQMGRDRSRAMRSDWEQSRDEVMRTALSAKFSQHPDLLDILLSTGNCLLVEHTTNDSYWGDGGDGSGANRLGSLLMELRDRFPDRPQKFLPPPWIEFPDVVVKSDMCWRMGAGEDYFTSWSIWQDKLSAGARAEYDKYFPVPSTW